jgi:hypothetical protein
VGGLRALASPLSQLFLDRVAMKLPTFTGKEGECGGTLSPPDACYLLAGAALGAGEGA